MEIGKIGFGALGLGLNRGMGNEANSVRVIERKDNEIDVQNITGNITTVFYIKQVCEPSRNEDVSKQRFANETTKLSKCNLRCH